MNTSSLPWRRDESSRSSTTAEVFPDPHFPIEQQVRSIAHSCQRAFAADIVRRLRRVTFRDALVHATDDGIMVLARHELALRDPLHAILDAHGIGLHLDAPRARERPGPRMRRPVMHLELRVARCFARPVLRELRARQAHTLAVRIGPFHLHIRAEALQADLFGFPAWIGRLTDGRARVALRLSRFASSIDETADSGVSDSATAAPARGPRLVLSWLFGSRRLARWTFAPSGDRAAAVPPAGTGQR